MDKHENETNEKKTKEKEGDIMSTIKPIQATPILSGEDAKALINEVLKKPTGTSIKRNSMLVNVLNNIKK